MLLHCKQCKKHNLLTPCGELPLIKKEGEFERQKQKTVPLVEKFIRKFRREYK